LGRYRHGGIQAANRHKLAKHIFMADKGDYYELADGCAKPH
jgi:hypothetical protein